MLFDVGAMHELMEATERAKIKELREHGIIGNVVLFVHPKHRGIIEEALFRAGIRRIPVIYTNFVEETNLIASTDKDLVENCKKALGWEE